MLVSIFHLNSIMILLIQINLCFRLQLKKDLNSIMILLIQYSTNRSIRIYIHLNSIMILLIRYSIRFNSTNIFTFKFHYDSINSMSVLPRSDVCSFHLNSIMILLIHLKLKYNGAGGVI